YVCSPYSGDIEKNIQVARQASRYVVNRGHVPITPHLLLPQFMSEESERDLVMEMNTSLLKKCDAVWFFGDVISRGMDYELTLASNIPIPVIDYTDLEFEYGTSGYLDTDEFVITQKGEDLLDNLSKGLDNVNHPSHYTFGQYEVLDVIEDWDLPFHLANVVKYIARAKHKGNEIQDLLKAQFYLNRYVDIKKTKEGEKFCEEID
ncbi:MAG TPA: DUF3310 domain-containing protein, partial [Tissierellaceae bacterium]|nr:DUF3310 domain-containing protein [Tissierellaceae bacterium]